MASGNVIILDNSSVFGKYFLKCKPTVDDYTWGTGANGFHVNIVGASKIKLSFSVTYCYLAANYYVYVDGVNKVSTLRGANSYPPTTITFDYELDVNPHGSLVYVGVARTSTGYGGGSHTSTVTISKVS